MDLLEARQRRLDASQRHPWELARLEVMRSLIARHVAPGAGTAVLDIGCGDTFVVERLAATFPEVLFYAVDTAFTDELIAHYRARLSVRNVVVSSSLDTAVPPLDRRVSLVILMDVLEHIADDRAFLTGLMTHPAIGAGAHVLVTVPSYQALFCSHDEVLGHYRRYSNRQLRRLLEGSGLAVIDIGYFFSSLVLARTVQVIKERGLKRRNDAGTTGLVTWKGSATLSEIMKRILVTDVHVSGLLRRIGVTLPGLSNYAICRKPA
jgi:hypothetical protein